MLGAPFELTIVSFGQVIIGGVLSMSSIFPGSLIAVGSGIDVAVETSNGTGIGIKLKS